MKKVIISSIVILFALSVHGTVLANSTEAGPNTSTNKEKSEDTGEGTEVSKTKKEGVSTTKDKGAEKSRRRESGARTAVRKEISKVMEAVESNGMTKEFQPSALFYEKLAKHYPDIYKININDVLAIPVETNGTINTSMQEGLSAIARGRSIADEYIDKPKLLEFMRRLAKTGAWGRRELAGIDKLKFTLGYEDWDEMIDGIVISNARKIESQKVDYNLDGACRFIGDYTSIQCGACKLDLTMNNAMPELICSGRPVFTGQGFGGVKLTVTANTSASLRDAETAAQSDEKFRAYTEALNEYEKRARSESKSVDAVRVKKAFFNSLAKNSSKTDIAIKSMSNNEDPTTILGTLGLK
ncbi:hypothetical protein [Geotalea sp. SG265]|uniref:hypothetical protein n=1 Tax=Geotalea sp. SG265 TaxID=2922867 RepID=UPI001FB02078|nr:hypothetical protein [Geotalea sp. SG265]